MTIQRYLLIVILSVVVLATFSAALQGFKASNNKLTDVFDQEMQSIAYTLKNSPMALSTEPVDTHSAFAFQIWQRGILLSRSVNAPESLISSEVNGFGYKSFLGNRWRYYSMIEDEIHVIVAQPVSQRIESIEEVLLQAVLPIVYVIPLIGVLIYLAIRKSLQPLRDLSAQVKQKHASDLSPIAVHANTSDLVPIETTINGLLTRLCAAFEREKTLASNAAHELRTPISVLKLNSHNIKVAFEAGDIQAHHLEELEKNTDRMAHVIEQVIALNRTTPENFQAKKEQVNLESLLQEVIANNYTLIEEQQQSISLNTEQIYLIADKFSLETLFDNLVKNAIKYSGLTSEISISAQRFDESVVCVVEDSGCGMTDEQMEKAFQRFYRAKQHEQTGSGLGLSIVSHIVQLHQGQIALSHSVLGGLKVAITLPIKEKVAYGSN